MDKLKELLDGLVAEKSLSFDVLEQLRKVKAESEELVKTNLLLGEAVTDKDELLTKKDSKILELSNKIGGWINRENSLIEREKAVLDIEHKNEIEKLKATHSESTLTQVKEIVGIVFRNTSIKRSMFGNEACSIPQGGYAGSASVNKTEEIKEE